MPRMVKDVQKLTGRIATLKKFVSKVTDKYLPFFKTLKQAFTWMEEYEKAFLGAKTLLEQPTTPEPIKGGREPVFVFSIISHSCECGLG